jgi:hypothetical protein
VHPAIRKSFGGLSRHYFIRQFLFGLIFPALMLMTLAQDKGMGPAPFGIYGLLIINTLLYPYSRFVYESVVGYIIGKNTFFVSAPLMLFAKLMTMTMCWAFAIVVAPIGLLYLYFHHSGSSAK